MQTAKIEHPSSTAPKQHGVTRFAAGALLAVASLAAIACSTDRQPSSDEPASSPVSRADTSKPIVYFGVISRYNPRLMFEGYQPIMDYLTENTPYRFELKLGKTYEDAVRYLRDGTVQLASLGAVTYLEAHKAFGAIPILRPLSADGTPYYHSVTVVREDSPFHTLSDLKGHSFAFASVHSTSGNLIPRYYLATAGLHLADFSSYQNLRHHDSVAKAVLEGRFDAGALKDVVAEKYLDRGLRILHRSEPIPSVPITVRADCDSALIKAVKAALLKIDPTDPAMQRQLRTWDREFRHGFVEASDRDYAGVRRMLNEIPRRCGQGCHPILTF